MDKITEFEGRLREVEKTVVRIDERIKHMPTTAQLWKALALAGGATIAAILGGGWWAVQQYLAPILANISK